MWNVPDAAFEHANVYEISADGNRLIGSVNVEGGRTSLDVKPGQAVALKAVKE